MFKDLHITIVGAGIAGLSTALALEQQGFAQIHILERSEALPTIGSGIQLGPNAVRALVKLGLGDPLRMASNSSAVGEIHAGETSKKSYLGDLPLSTHSLRAYGQPCYQLLRSDLLRILYKAASDRGIDVQFGCQIETVEQFDESNLKANVVFDHGAKQATDLVIVADGIGSKISAQLFPEQPLVYSGLACWRALIDRDLLGEHWFDQVRVFTGSDKHLVVYPVANSTKLNLVATTNYPVWDSTERVRHSTVDEWLSSYAGWSEDVLALISKAEETQLWGLFERQPLLNWHVGCVVVIGDAAHPMLPSLAQGAAQAIEDGIELAEILNSFSSKLSSEISAKTNPGSEDLTNRHGLGIALSHLYNKRQDRVARVQKATRWNLNYFHQPAGLYRSVRNHAMKIAGPVASRIISSRYDWLYADHKK